MVFAGSKRRATEAATPATSSCGRTAITTMSASGASVGDAVSVLYVDARYSARSREISSTQMWSTGYAAALRRTASMMALGILPPPMKYRFAPIGSPLLMMYTDVCQFP